MGRANIIIAVLMVSFGNMLPVLLKLRDSLFYVVPEPSKGHQMHHGFIHIEHSEETMNRVMKGATGVANINMYYETSVKEEDRSNANGDHIVLIHGTGISSQIWFCEDNENMADLFMQAGYHVTLIDLRGHGQSTVTDGAYTVQLLAADVAETMKSLYPNRKFNVVGLSVGFGVTMALSLDYPELCNSIAGSGFLFDRSRRDVAAYIFSRKPVVQLLGLNFLSKIGEVVLQVNEPGLSSRSFKYTTIEGYVHTSSAWLKFNETDRLPTHSVPTLIMNPEKDAVIGHTPELHHAEIKLMPKNIGEYIYFPGYSHMMCCEEGGARKQFEAVHNFLLKRGLKA